MIGGKECKILGMALITEQIINVCSLFPPSPHLSFLPFFPLPFFLHKLLTDVYAKLVLLVHY